VEARVPRPLRRGWRRRTAAAALAGLAAGTAAAAALSPLRRPVFCVAAFAAAFLTAFSSLALRIGGQTLWERFIPFLEYLLHPGEREWTTRREGEIPQASVAVVGRVGSLRYRLLTGLAVALFLFALLSLLSLLRSLWEGEAVQAEPPLAACGHPGIPGVRWFRLNTRGDFDGWALFASPGGEPLPLLVQALPGEAGALSLPQGVVRGRLSLYLDASLPGQEVWLGVSTGEGVVAEHSLFLDSGGYTGPAVPPAGRWCFPPGGVGGWGTLYILNPNPVTATVSLLLCGPEGAGRERVALGPGRGAALPDEPGAGLILEASAPVAAERVVEVGEDLYDIPPSCPSPLWYFPPTMGEEVRLALFNPGDEEVRVTVRAWGGGRSASVSLTLPPLGTRVVPAGACDGMEVRATGDVTALQVVCREGGKYCYSLPGRRPTAFHLLPEGDARYPYQVFALIFNPSDGPVRGEVRRLEEGGGVHRGDLPFELGPRQGARIRVSRPRRAFALEIEAEGPVVAGRVVLVEGKGMLGD